MYTVEMFPTVVVQEVLNGGNLTGVLPTGALMVDSQETLLRGRYRKYTKCEDAGLILQPSRIGISINRVSWILPGVSEFQIFCVDEDDFEYALYAATKDGTILTVESGSFYPQQNEVVMVPGWKVKLVAADALTGDGRVMVVFGKPMDHLAFDEVGSIGRSERPPGMWRP